MTSQFESMPPAWSSIFQAEELAPTLIRQPGTEIAVAVTTVLRHERRWPADAAVPDSYGSTPNKPRLHLDGELLYPELILVRLLEKENWSVGWMNNWKRTFGRSIGEPVEIPEHIEQLLDHIGACTGKRRHGCWDVVAWKGDAVAFVESKQRGKDEIRETQVRWLTCALEQGVPASSFAIVEWEARRFLASSE
jgi:hypothetical protein